MSLQNPPVFEHGFVVGRYVTAVADTLQDEDRYPDLRPITGRVRFTPLQSVHLKGGEYPATVVKQPITVDLNEQGYVEDVESRNDPNRNPGVYLAVGLYRVEPVFENVSSISRFTIQVTADHTKDNPLDLTLAAPIETPPGFTEVVRIIDRVRAEDAAEQAESHAATALVYRDEAAQSATTAQTHSTTAGESAEAAEGHADRAEAARDDTLAQAIEVDTSVGTKVTVGGHVVHYDTGPRDISNLLHDGFRLSSRNGSAILRRENSLCMLTLFVTVTDSPTAEIVTLPLGFRHPADVSAPGRATVSTSPDAALPLTERNWYMSGTTGLVRLSGAMDSGTVMLSASWITDQSIPSSLPGTPA